MNWPDVHVVLGADVIDRRDLITSAHNRSKQIARLIGSGLIVDKVRCLLKQFRNPTLSSLFFDRSKPLQRRITQFFENILEDKNA